MSKPYDVPVSPSDASSRPSPDPERLNGLEAQAGPIVVPRPIRIEATNYDGSPHWSHAAELIEHSDGLLLTRTRSGCAVKTERGIWNSPYDTVGHYWPDRWFNVIRLHTNGGELNGFYCNIASPATFDGAALHYVDLQLDVRVFVSGGDWTYTVLDADEFEEARQRYRYPADFIVRCRQAVEECIALIEDQEFPFERTQVTGNT